MAKYEFKCHICGIIKEVHKAMTDKKIPKHCNTPMQRVYNSPSFSGLPTTRG